MPLFEVVKVFDEGPNGTLGVKVYDSYIEDGQWKDRDWTNDDSGTPSPITTSTVLLRLCRTSDR